MAHPVGTRLGGHAGDPDGPGVVVDEEQHVEPAEQHGVDAQEVASDQPVGAENSNWIADRIF